jgi:hypothetical protein
VQSDGLQMSDEKRIIFITDLIDQRLRKEKEIEFYEAELRKIEQKLFFLRKEQSLTQFIIEIIQNEKVVDLREQFYEKMSNNQLPQNITDDNEGDG